jgi:drug/metabolite transporter (DMT)-like permease
VSEEIFDRKISPVTLLLFQMMVGVIIFSIVAYHGQVKADLSAILHNSTLFWLVVTSLLTFSVGNILIFIAIQAKNATVTGLIEISYPLFTAFFSWVLYNKDYFTTPVMIGGALIFVGIAVISYS